MAEESFEEKTEKATPRRQEEARKKGEVAKSRELASTAVLLAGLVALMLSGSYIYNQVQAIMADTFTQIASRDLAASDFIAFAERAIRTSMLAIVPVLGAVFFAAIASNVLQIGYFVFSAESITPKLSKLNPIKGLGRLFSKQSFMELFKSLVKLGIIGGIAYITIKGETENTFMLGDMDVRSILTYTLSTIFEIFFKCTLAMVFLVIIDYAFQKYEHERKLKMTKKEIKDESKLTEGDPMVKSRIRSIQREIARKRMMQAVPDADVVITNPTHLAVALKYDSDRMGAPVVLAKGAGLVAEKIRDIASSHGIPIVEDKEIARSIFAAVEVGQEIPSTLWHAVAEIMAYVYGLRKDYAGGVT